jgi:hypothetical protein
VQEGNLRTTPSRFAGGGLTFKGNLMGKSGKVWKNEQKNRQDKRTSKREISFVLHPKKKKAA